MALGLNETLRNAMLDEITTRAGNGALLRIYSGTRPASTAGAITSQVLLAQLTCASPLGIAASSGVLTFGNIQSDTSALDTLTATWFRLVNAAGTTHVMDGDISTVAAGTGAVGGKVDK